MTDFKGGGIPTPDSENEDVNFIGQKTEFYDDVFVYGKLYAEFGGDVQTFSTAGVERVRITKEGDVAIGSNNPNVIVDASNTSILSVGIVTAREFYGIFKGSIDPAVANDKISEGNSAAEVIDSGSDGRFIVTTEGVERFLIYANGKLVIPDGNTNGNFVRDTVDTYQWNGTDTNANIPDSSIGLQIRNNDQTTHKTAALAEFRTYRNSSTANPGVVYIGAVDPGDGNAHRSDFIVALKNGSTTVNERLRIKHDGVINCGHGDEINLHGTTTTGINLNGNNNSGQIIANASGNRALIIGRQGSFGQVIEFFQGTNTNEASITIPAANTFAVTTNGDNERFRINSNGGVKITVKDDSNNENISDKTAILIENGGGAGDIGPDSEPTHIDWTWRDNNSNATPQCRISGNVGDGGDPNSLEKEGRGFLTFHCSNTTSSSGDQDPPQRLRIAHNGTFTGSSSNNISDQRLKENIATITDPITKIKALKGRTFTWKSEANMREGTHYGFIAQEVESIIPDLIVDDTGIRIFDKDDNLLPNNVFTPPVGGGYAKSVDSDGVTPVLVEALKEALSKIETLEAKVAALEGS